MGYGVSGIANAVRVERQTAEGELVSRLEGARSRIEQRFLDGGVVLLSVLDVLNRLVASLENLSGSLGDEAAEATIGRLIATAHAHAGTVTEWLVEDGDPVSPGQPLLRLYPAQD